MTRTKAPDEKAFLASRDELVTGFERWAARNHLRIDSYLAEIFCDYKWAYRDGELRSWGAEDVVDLLLAWFPRKVASEPITIERTIPTLKAYLRFVHDTPVEGLVELCDRLAADFRESMDDVSLFGPSKRMLAVAESEGVDLSDVQALERWIESFNTRPFEERAGILPVPDDYPDELPSLPSVALASSEELERAAAESDVLRRLLAFAAWAGGGRKLTQKRNILRADAPELIELLGTRDVIDPDIGGTVFRTTSTTELTGVDYVYRLARAAGLVRVARSAVASTKAARSDLLEGWGRAFRGFTKMRYVTWRHPERVGLGRPFWAGYVDDAIPDLLGLIYARTEPVPFDQIVELMWAGLREDFDLEDLDAQARSRCRDWLTSDIESVLDRLQDLGAAIRRGGEVFLTALGMWGTNRLLRERGFDAPVVGEYAHADAITMLVAVSDLDAADLEREVRTWADVHGAEAPRLLADALRACEDPELKMCAVAALSVVHASSSDPGSVERFVRELVDVPGARTYALAWLLERGLVDEDAIGHEEAATALVAAFDALGNMAGPRAVVEALSSLATPDEQAAMVGELWRIPSPDVGGVLETIGRHHPDRRVAKAARKSLFKVRSGAGS